MYVFYCKILYDFSIISGRVRGLRNIGQNFSFGLQGSMGCLEREIEEEWFVITVGIQVSSLTNRPDYFLASLFEHNGGVFSLIFPRHLLSFSKVVESWRIFWGGFVVAIVTEVVLRAEIEAQKGVKTSPGWSVL